MADQLAFPGFDDTRPATDRLLFLTYVDPDAAAQIARRVPDLRAEHGLRGKPVAQDRLHVTLNHLGDHAGLPQDIVALARVAAGMLAMALFDVEFDRVVSFCSKPSNRPFVLRGSRLAQLIAFQKALGLAMARTGTRVGKWAEPNFTPHVTLLYDDKSIAEQSPLAGRCVSSYWCTA
jgi:2'-5' RNA ligase